MLSFQSGWITFIDRFYDIRKESDDLERERKTYQNELQYPFRI